jgi:hypothetical protein
MFIKNLINPAKYETYLANFILHISKKSLVEAEDININKCFGA